VVQWLLYHKAGSVANLDNLFMNHKPSHSTTTVVSHGGHNILYGKFSQFKNEWNPFEKTFSELHHLIASVVYSLTRITQVWSSQD